MLRNALIALGIVMLTAGPSFARSLEKAPPPPPYQKVSTLVPLPNFLPGIGTLYVNSKTLPEGPYLAYDHQGHEQAGMVGCPIVGKAIGPGSFPSTTSRRWGSIGFRCRPRRRRRSPPLRKSFSERSSRRL